MIELLKNMVIFLKENNIPYMLTGSLAFNIYTTPRSTRDIDIVVMFSPKHVPLIKETYGERFYFHEATVRTEILGKGTGMFNLIDNRTGYKIDFILLKNSPYELEKFKRRKTILFEGFDFQVICAEDLLLSKLQWIQQIQSPIQMKDIQTLWQLPGPDKKYVLNWININTENIRPVAMNTKDIPQDTTPEMMARQQAWFAEKTPEERFMMGLQMAEDGRQLALAGIRMQYPEYSEKEQIKELSRRFYPELFQ